MFGVFLATFGVRSIFTLVALLIFTFGYFDTCDLVVLVGAPFCRYSFLGACNTLSLVTWK